MSEFDLNAPDPGVIDETGRYGNANHHSLPPAERRKRAARLNERARRWAQAEAVRAGWTPEQFAQEEQRLREEIENWGQRDAA